MPRSRGMDARGVSLVEMRYVGESPRNAGPRRRTLRLIERLTIFHVVVFAIATTWAFGGQADWVRGPLVAWGCGGFLLFLAAALHRSAGRVRWDPMYMCVAPLALFNIIVLAATFNPSMREIRIGGEPMLAIFGGFPWLPSSARPALARAALLEFDAIWISSFNVAFILQSRRAIRIVLGASVLNALVLSIFGTAQKLSGAAGLYFGRVPSPQQYFFSSFVYHNHWGAFAILMTAAGLGLTHFFARRFESRNVLHSPALLGAVVLLIIAATIPLSASRSSTALLAAMLLIAFGHWVRREIEKRRHFNESVAAPVSVALVALCMACLGIWYVASDTIRSRASLTIQQVHDAETNQQPNQRLMLYKDTWRMAEDKLWFGWGMASYPHVFTTYNTRVSSDRLPVFYHDAHSDWLQSLAEHGVVGTACLIALAVLPLVLAVRRRRLSPLAGYTLLGCALIVVYGALEFPFGNFAVVLTWWVCYFCAVQYLRLGDSSPLKRMESCEVPSHA